MPDHGPIERRIVPVSVPDVITSDIGFLDDAIEMVTN
jgi:hypothetical protein